MAHKRPQKTPQLVAVHWLDAAGDRDESPEKLEPIDAITCGFLVYKGKREDGEEYLKVAGEIFTDGSYRDVTAIPLGMVRKVTAKPIKLPPAFDRWEAVGEDDE